jgi:hypothetical protein
MAERASAPLSICLSDPQGRDGAVAQKGAQNSVKKEVHFRDLSIKGERAREPRAAHPSPTHRSPSLTLLARCECLKQHGVGGDAGELGADFSSLVVPFSSVYYSPAPAILQRLLFLQRLDFFSACHSLAPRFL